MNSIKIIDWQADFIVGLGAFTADLDPSRTLILFPHNRPARHLKAWYQSAPLPLPRLLPDMASFDGFVTRLRNELIDRPLRPAEKLDQIALLLEIVSTLSAASTGLLSRLPVTPEAFFPWGMRLAGLLEEFLRQGITPQNLAHMGQEVAPWGAALLEQLGTISEAYVAGLHERNWTTPGLDHRLIASNLDRTTELLGQTTVIAAGFYALSGTEDALFKHLWDAGRLEVLWHTDPALAEQRPGHPDVSEHRLWLRNWKATAEQIGPAPINGDGPEVSFIEGFDLHSQLRGLKDELSRDDGSDTAIVLPETGALLPLLHQLPGGDELPFNISMGYPLERTSLFQLMDTVLRLQESSDSNGNSGWRELLELLRHPYLNMLEPDPDHQTGALRRVFHSHASSVRQGEKFQNPIAWNVPYGHAPLEDVTDRDGSLEAFRRKILGVCLTGFTGLETLAQLAQALSDLADLLKVNGAHLWPRYVIDAEYLARLTTSVIPQLSHSAMSHEPLGQGTIFSVLRSMCRAERVSFEPEPLTGLQIMGVLETRLLTFKRLYVLDAVEDKLPSSSPYDPLLPDPLRHAVGLPDSHERDNVSAYNFKRLLMGAQSAVLLYQSGVQPGLFDSKSVRSRYVEELIWQREKAERRGKDLIKPGEKPITLVHFPASPIPGTISDIDMSDDLAEKLKTYLTGKGLNATSMDCWLTCPKKFFYRYLARLRPADNVNEAGDRAAFGELIHNVLKDFLTPCIGQDMDLSLLDAQQLVRDFQTAFDADDRMNQAAWDVRLALRSTAEIRLTRFLKAQGQTRILSLEDELRASLAMREGTVPLKGFLDRVDERESEGDSGIWVLDYKTGMVHAPKRGMWDDMDLWERIEAREQGDREDADFLRDLRGALHSVQLPLYLYLYDQATGSLPREAGWIELAKDGKESLLFGPKWTIIEREETVRTMIPRLLRALAADMFHAPTFQAITDTHCQWCDYRGPCGR